MHNSLQAVRVDDRRFIFGMTVTLLLVVFAGFADTYFLWPITRVTHAANGRPLAPSLPLMVHAHALLFTGWMLLITVQAGLVASGRVARHRRLGRVGAVLVPLMLVTGFMTSIEGARNGWNPGGPYPDGLSFMFVGIMDLTVFASLTTAGLLFRRHADLHKRLMLLGTLGLMWPAVTRIPLLAGRVPLMFAVLFALVLTPAVRDFWRGARTRWITLAVGVGICATFPLRVAIGNSSAWRSVAAWLTQ